MAACLPAGPSRLVCIKLDHFITKTYNAALCNSITARDRGKWQVHWGWEREMSGYMGLEEGGGSQERRMERERMREKRNGDSQRRQKSVLQMAAIAQHPPYMFRPQYGPWGETVPAGPPPAGARGGRGRRGQVVSQSAARARTDLREGSPSTQSPRPFWGCVKAGLPLPRLASEASAVRPRQGSQQKKRTGAGRARANRFGFGQHRGGDGLPGALGGRGRQEGSLQVKRRGREATCRCCLYCTHTPCAAPRRAAQRLS